MKKMPCLFVRNFGPKVNGNADRHEQHVLIKHGTPVLEMGRSFDELRDYLSGAPIEGIVFAHPDGRMAKIRRDDFGFPWPPVR